MTLNKKIFIDNFLDKSKEALIDAKININNDRLNNDLNRIYYAVFYSVMALGYLENFITSKHSQLMGWFNKKFIYENPIFDKEMYQIYKVSYANRQESDYTIFTKPVKENVIKSYEDAKRFIKEVTSYIKEKTSKINDDAK